MFFHSNKSFVFLRIFLVRNQGHRRDVVSTYYHLVLASHPELYLVMQRTSLKPDENEEPDNPPQRDRNQETSSDDDDDENPVNSDDDCENMKARYRHCGMRNKPRFFGSHTSDWCWMPELQRKCSVCRSTKHNILKCPLRKTATDDYCQVCGMVYRKHFVDDDGIKPCTPDKCTSTRRSIWPNESDYSGYSDYSEDSDYIEDREEDDNEAGAPLDKMNDLNLKK